MRERCEAAMPVSETLNIQQERDIEGYAQDICDTIRNPLLIVDADLRVRSANRAFYRVFNTSAKQTEGRVLTQLGNGQSNIRSLVDLLRRVIPELTNFDDYEITASFPHLGLRAFLINARKLIRPANSEALIVIGFEDITDRRRLEQETAVTSDRNRLIAESLQRSLLFMPAEDAFPGFAVRAVFDAGADDALVGGDFWDAFAFGESSMAKYTLRAFIHEHRQPSRALKQANEHVCEVLRLYRDGLNALGNHSPLCIVVATIDTTTGRGEVCSAGMEPLLVIRRAGGSEPIDTIGLPLGVEPDAVYHSAAFELMPGDSVLISTDGITEARQRNDFLGYEGLRDLVEAARSMPTLQQNVQYILDGARAFAKGKLVDDACLLTARRL
jgi:PAS domain-containing protein